MEQKGSQEVHGYIDGIDGEYLCGWAYDVNNPGTAIELTILIDGAFAGNVSAELNRPDLEASKIPHHDGFQFLLPPHMMDGKMHIVDVSRGNLALENSPVRIVFPARVAVPRDSGFEGHLDGVSNGFAVGWVMDGQQREAIVFADLLVDGQFVRSVEAGEFRQDLINHYGSGRHGFSTPVPSRFLDEKIHTVAVVIAGTDMHLANSPLRTKLEFGPCRVLEPERTQWARRYFSGHFAAAASSSISVVIPTFNRGELMERTLRACIAHGSGIDAEWIVLDDGSTDDTAKRLARLQGEFRNLRFESGPNRGPGHCRNLGASMAVNKIVLFIGDDVQPASPDFLTAHAFAHEMMPQRNVGVLGKVVWPNQPNEDINFVMSHIQGIGQEQFGFYALKPYDWLDWRFFYTSNVSVKKNVVKDWLTDGFSKVFPHAAYEDGEFAYRLNQAFADGFKILYTPASTATHHHPYTVKSFMRRQAACGKMARVFLNLHPEAGEALGIHHIQRILDTPTAREQGSIDDYLAMIDGIRAWPSIIEQAQKLGSQNWHADLLAAVFELSYFDGFIVSDTNPDRNVLAAYQYLVRRFQDRMARAATIETFGRFVPFAVV